MILYNTWKFLRNLFGSRHYWRKQKVTVFKMFVQLFLIAINVFWMYHTYRLISLELEIRDTRYNPWDVLGLVMPANPYKGFNTSKVKKAYRLMARMFHPDKVGKLPEEEQRAAAKKWEIVLVAYETLTQEHRF
jgi:preprotein translocase subunit Sec63